MIFDEASALVGPKKWDRNVETLEIFRNISQFIDHRNFGSVILRVLVQFAPTTGVTEAAPLDMILSFVDRPRAIDVLTCLAHDSYGLPARLWRSNEIYWDLMMSGIYQDFVGL